MAADSNRLVYNQNYITLIRKNKPLRWICINQHKVSGNRVTKANLFCKGAEIETKRRSIWCQCGLRIKITGLVV